MSQSPGRYVASSTEASLSGGYSRTWSGSVVGRGVRVGVSGGGGGDAGSVRVAGGEGGSGGVTTGGRGPAGGDGGILMSIKYNSQILISPRMCACVFSLQSVKKNYTGILLVLQTRIVPHGVLGFPPLFYFLE